MTTLLLGTIICNTLDCRLISEYFFTVLVFQLPNYTQTHYVVSSHNLIFHIHQMMFSLCVVLLVTVWQASAQAPGDEDTRCLDERAQANDVYPPLTKMLMDSRN